jgi:hypothetical protein
VPAHCPPDGCTTAEAVPGSIDNPSGFAVTVAAGPPGRLAVAVSGPSGRPVAQTQVGRFTTLRPDGFSSTSNSGNTRFARTISASSCEVIPPGGTGYPGATPNRPIPGLQPGEFRRAVIALPARLDPEHALVTLVQVGDLPG